MARPIWTGTLSFGLLNVPIRLMSGERRNDLHFRMLDQRDNTPVRYERVNADTGEEVPWKDIVKAFEYQKGNYVVLEEDDIRNAASDAHETVEIDTFVDASEISPAYYEKPYVLLPAKKAEKGYVLLRETLKKNRQGRHRPRGHPDEGIPCRRHTARRCPGPQPAALQIGGRGRGRLRTAGEIHRRLPHHIARDRDGDRPRRVDVEASGSPRITATSSA